MNDLPHPEASIVLSHPPHRRDLEDTNYFIMIMI